MTSKSASGPRPNSGSIRFTRQTLGLTLGTIAKRLGIHRQNVLQYEISEERGQIRLGNLRRIAEAMDCELVYSIVPKQTGASTSKWGAKALGAKATEVENKIRKARSITPARQALS